MLLQPTIGLASYVAEKRPEAVMAVSIAYGRVHCNMSVHATKSKERIQQTEQHTQDIAYISWCELSSHRLQRNLGLPCCRNYARPSSNSGATRGLLLASLGQIRSELFNSFQYETHYTYRLEYFSHEKAVGLVSCVTVTTKKFFNRVRGINLGSARLEYIALDPKDAKVTRDIPRLPYP